MTLLDDLLFKAEDANFELEMSWKGKLLWPETAPRTEVKDKIRMVSIAEANRILREKLEKGRSVFNVPGTNNYWSENAGPVWNAEEKEWINPTITARLVDIREVKK